MPAPPKLSDEALGALVDIAFDHACTRPLSDYVDPDKLVASLDDALSQARVGLWQRRVTTPLRDRLVAEARGSKVKLGEYLPNDARDAIAALLEKPAPLPREIVEEFVASERVRDEVRAMLHDSLTGFVGKVTQGSPGGLRSMLGRGAANVAAAGKGLFGGLGEGLSKHMHERVRDFVDGSVAALQARIANALTSDDTAKRIGKERRRVFLRALERTEAEAAKNLAKLPLADIDRLVPKIIAHNLARTAYRDVLLREVRAVLGELSKEPVGVLLDESGLREHGRNALRAHAVPYLQSLVEVDAFRAWWTANVP